MLGGGRGRHIKYQENELIRYRPRVRLLLFPLVVDHLLRPRAKLVVGIEESVQRTVPSRQ
jgi:hypothetical protein